MKRAFKYFAIIAILLAVLFSLLSSGFAQEFSADYSVHEKKQNVSINGKIFIKGDKLRQETQMEGMKQIMIIRPDKNVIWMIMPKGNTYMEMSHVADDKKTEPWTSERESKAKYMGKETVSGLSCKKYQYIEQGETYYSWISEKFPFPVKTEYSQGLIEYKNIKEGKVPNSLFEVPPGYSKMSMPKMPQGMPQGMDIPNF
jgi:outer membrane lipoprotein-sorting protein